MTRIEWICPIAGLALAGFTAGCGAVAAYTIIRWWIGQ